MRSPTLLLLLLLASSSSAAGAEAPSAPGAEPVDALGPWTIPVVVVKFFPIKGRHIDISVTGDWGAPLDETRRKVERMNAELIEVLEAGSRYRAYRDPAARPSLKYTVLHTYEFIEPLPTLPAPEGATPLTDYRTIMQRVQAEYWVKRRGAREIWIWAYHGDKVRLWESNMSSPHGDVSNSNRDPNDLPVFDHTYTVYHYNYQRSAAMAVHNHMHQIEALLNHVDGRDASPKSKWSTLLFWGRFVGSDGTQRLREPIAAGWCHYPPNAEKDYDYANRRVVSTDIEDWNPQRTGKRIEVDCEHWGCDDLRFYRWWMQSLPGASNGLHFEGRPLRNWWVFTGDWDSAHGLKLTRPARRVEQPR